VQTFGSDEQLEAIIQTYAPDVMVVGGDYKNKRVIGAEHARQLVFFDRLEDYSSTQIYNKIKRENI
jgi:bifunctional ADP-heptose synthase (sugar kinase/adenylyltransferase)